MINRLMESLDRASQLGEEVVGLLQQSANELWVFICDRPYLLIVMIGIIGVTFFLYISVIERLTKKNEKLQQENTQLRKHNAHLEATLKKAANSLLSKTD